MTVSRQHAYIDRVENEEGLNEIWLSDNESKFGTSALLRKRDRVPSIGAEYQLGKTIINIEIGVQEMLH